MAFDNSHDFNISVTGDTTEENFHGAFTAKRLLSHGDQIAVDARAREMLGTNPQFASPRTASQAEILADLQVRLTKVPAWWTASAGGADLLDTNVLRVVYESAVKPERDHQERLAKKALATQAELKKAEPPKE